MGQYVIQHMSNTGACLTGFPCVVPNPNPTHDQGLAWLWGSTVHGLSSRVGNEGVSSQWNTQKQWFHPHKKGTIEKPPENHNTCISLTPNPKMMLTPHCLHATFKGGHAEFVGGIEGGWSQCNTQKYWFHPHKKDISGKPPENTCMWLCVTKGDVNTWLSPCHFQGWSWRVCRGNWGWLKPMQHSEVLISSTQKRYKWKTTWKHVYVTLCHKSLCWHWLSPCHFPGWSWRVCRGHWGWLKPMQHSEVVISSTQKRYKWKTTWKHVYVTLCHKSWCWHWLSPCHFQGWSWRVCRGYWGWLKPMQHSEVVISSTQ
jgi:hypothetical protein